MDKKRIIMIALAATLAIVFVSGTGCDSTEAKIPQLILNVKLDEVYPVSAENKIYIVFYIANDWVTPWMTLSFPMRTIITPELNIGDYPLFFEVWYDSDGDGLPTAGVDFYQGWKGKIDRSSDTLDPLPVADTEIMYLNFDLDNNDTF